MPLKRLDGIYFLYIFFLILKSWYCLWKTDSRVLTINTDAACFSAYRKYIVVTNTRQFLTDLMILNKIYHFMAFRV